MAAIEGEEVAIFKRKIHHKRYLAISIILFVVAVGILFYLAFFVSYQGVTPKSPGLTQIQSRTSAYSWRTQSPHWVDENGKPYIKTADVIFGVDNSDIVNLFGSSTDAVKAHLSKWLSWQNDLVMWHGYNWTDKNINPTIESFRDLGWLHQVDKSDNSQDSLWYFLNATVRDSNQFEDLFFHSNTYRDYGNGCVVQQYNSQNPAASRLPAKRDCNLLQLNITHPRTRNFLINYWTGIGKVKLNEIINGSASDGAYWDSGILWMNNDYGVPEDTYELKDETPVSDGSDGSRKYYQSYKTAYENYLGEIFFDYHSFQEPKKKLFLNSANFFPENYYNNSNARYYYGEFTHISQNEHFVNHEWVYDNFAQGCNQGQKCNDHILDSIRKLNWLKDLNQNIYAPHAVELITQTGEYNEVNHYAYQNDNDPDKNIKWRKCGSKDLAQRMQISALASYYIIKRADYDTFFRESGEGCGLETNPNGGRGIAAWTYDAVARLNRAVAYNVGQPQDEPTELKRITYRDWNPYGPGGVPQLKDDTISSVLKRDFAHATVYYRSPKYGLEHYKSKGMEVYRNALPYKNELSVYKADGQSSDFPIRLNKQVCYLGYDGSIRGPFDKLTLYQHDGAIAVDCGIKVAGFELSQVDELKSSSTWWEDSLLSKKTFINYRPLEVDYANKTNEMFQDNTLRPARITLAKNNITVEFSEDIILNPAQTIDLDDADNVNFQNSSNQASIMIDAQHIPQFNKSARITVDGLTISKPIIMKNSSPCPPSECQIISYQNGRLIFQVNSFSTYRVLEDTGRGDGGSGDGGGNQGNPTPSPTTGSNSGSSSGSSGGGNTGSSRSSGGSRSTGGSGGSGSIVRVTSPTPSITSSITQPSPTSTSKGPIASLPEDEKEGGLFKSAYLWSSIGGLIIVISLAFGVLAYRRALRRKLRQKRDREILENK